MNIKAVFMHMGLIIGDFKENMDGTYTIKNPVLFVAKERTATFAPFLNMMEEDEITVDKNDCFFKQVFTPAVNLRNEYNRIFGSGIIEAASNLELK